MSLVLVRVRIDLTMHDQSLSLLHHQTFHIHLERALRCRQRGRPVDLTCRISSFKDFDSSSCFLLLLVLLLLSFQRSGFALAVAFGIIVLCLESSCVVLEFCPVMELLGGGDFKTQKQKNSKIFWTEKRWEKVFERETEGWVRVPPEKNYWSNFKHFVPWQGIAPCPRFPLRFFRLPGYYEVKWWTRIHWESAAVSNHSWSSLNTSNSPWSQALDQSWFT